MSGQKARSGGRNRLPASIKETKGTARQSRAKPNEPTPTPGIPLPPAWLSPEEVAAYHDLAADVKAMNVCSLYDGKALAVTASAFVDWRDAWKKVKREGTTIYRETKHGRTTVANPNVAIRADSWRRYRDGLREFGLSPQSRSSVSTLGAGKPTSEFFN